MRMLLRSAVRVSSSSASPWVAETMPPGLPLKSTPPVIIASRNLCTMPAWRLPARAAAGCASASKRVGTIAWWSGLVKIWKFENVLAAGDRSARQPAGEDLRQRRQIGSDAVLGLRPAWRNPEAGDDLVEDQQHAMLPGQFTQLGQEFRVDRQLRAVSAGRLED